MFEFLFKYPASAFAKGTIVLLGRWPVWVLVVLVLLAALLLAYPFWRQARSSKAQTGKARSAVIWLLQTCLAALVLLLLWQPSLILTTLKPQQNIVAVLIDDSRSMALKDTGTSRRDQAAQMLDSPFLQSLKGRFQVRLYRLGAGAERIEKKEQLQAALPVTRIGDSLQQVMTESAGLPLGAVVLLSDGGDNRGGIDLDTLNEVRRRHVPVHTVGFGREQFARDAELRDVQIAPRTLSESRLNAVVTFVQHGYKGRKARLVLRDGAKVVTAREVVMQAEGTSQTETLTFQAGPAGAKLLRLSLEGLDNEENNNNNSLTRLVNVEQTKPRILYLEGEPRWEFKFIRRAVEEDQTLQLVSLLRTTQNKMYRQGINVPNELEQGFPVKVEDLFQFQGIIVGDVEANYFTPSQQELLRQFADRRGGGVLFLGGRNALADGGMGRSPLAEMLPVSLPDRKGTFSRDTATVELTTQGRDSLICRLAETPDQNVERWKKMPPLADYQQVGAPKAGAVVLADLSPSSGGRSPLLVSQTYGRGRVAVLATSGTWRWQMQQDLADRTHEMFWQQLVRWLVSGTPGHVQGSTPQQVLSDETNLKLRTEVRDRSYMPMTDAKVEARILGPDNLSETVELRPEPLSPGVYSTEWNAVKPGSYVAEMVATRGTEEIGRDVLSVRREDGVAENFHAEQNKDLLEKLASQTGGKYYQPAQWRDLNRDINYSEAGLTVKETRDLWDMPVVFLAALLLRGSEWVLRRRWGAV